MERRLNRRKFVDPEDQKRLLLEEAIRNNKNVSLKRGQPFYAWEQN